MTNVIYDVIREENIGLYGTAVNEYGPTLLTELYSEKTHFIYELLQNAEDAYERLNKEDTRIKSVHFELYNDRLEIRHNGIPFDEEDIKGICRLASGTKKQDISQIGKFGIGFKSVYAYTKSPEIYSGHYCFCIKNYVHPYSINQRNDIIKGQTLFVIPLNNDKINQKDSYLEIKSKLIGLGARTLLFLKNIEEITWKIDGTYGKYYKKSNHETTYSRAILYSESNVSVISIENWLKFSRTISNECNNKSSVEIAYLVQNDENSKKEQIISADNTQLVVFFPTDKKTGLSFLIQGNFQTTTSRDNIFSNDWNKLLIEEIAILTAESLDRIKEMELLDVSFLQTLSIDINALRYNSTFLPISKKIKEKFLGDNALLPTYNGGYVTAKQAILANSQSLRELLSSKQISDLLHRENLQWLDGTITKDKTPELRSYLITELSVPEIDPDKFARDFSVDFIEKQSDEWVKKFYIFLLDQKALWKKYYQKGPLLSKEIIRLDNNSHVIPFSEEGKPNAYFPSEFRERFPTIKDNIANDPKAKEFLEELELQKPDDIAEIIDIILPFYKEDKNLPIDKEVHLQHIEWISKTILSSINSDRKRELLEILRTTPILYAKNICTGEILLKKPLEIYLGEKYTGHRDIETFFEENSNIYLLDSLYSNLNLDRIIFKKLGCKSQINITCKCSEWGNVTISSMHGWHKRSLNGFDPDSEIEGLEHALKNITVQKAHILWSILENNSKIISGTVESSSRQDYSNSTKSEEYSKAGKLLTEHQWIPDKENNFHLPSDLMLSDLPDEFNIKSPKAKTLAEKLKLKAQFMLEVAEYLKEKCPELEGIINEIQSLDEEDRMKLPELIASLKKTKQSQKKSSIYSLLGNETESTLEEHKQLSKKSSFSHLSGTQNESTLEKQENLPKKSSPSDIRKKFEKSLSKHGKTYFKNTNNSGWDNSVSPEEEEKIRQKYSDKFHKRLDGIKIKRKNSHLIKTEIYDSIDPKQFLFEQYRGHCQLCNTKLNIGSNQPYFSIYRIVETENAHEWTNMEFNVICLCPNCHALMKNHPNRNLDNILKIAKKILNYEVAPEEVKERKGDYYIIDVVVGGKKQYLYYKPIHMQKIAAFVEKTNN
ncbi:molecular chaperone of HSP90 family (plasmid) [Methanomethylovorans hollandica DSM 15978]|uniref:Molecular chaperone of HSP90 family n=1 Tax=Methanomethylovorans hollandica (strain DSM 15978 / NBRC 107637 / DMS1) TaxID=867904 RepID=L0L043_METHD|nr:molecular chaperone of HSP90 family [Methanomethylovorans hollandica]AGB50726.1 molecular chaperone of HSP90 family [Methanomethylovorans hollandica DSM 15978]